MHISLFDLFKVGIGPSSSHTVGPMVAAHRFVTTLPIDQVARIEVDLFGSLAMTGKGHSTDTAVLLGLLGEQPDQVDPDQVDQLLTRVQESGQLSLRGERLINFDRVRQIRFLYGQSLPAHPNGMRFRSYDAAGLMLSERVYYSLGGGFVVSEQELGQSVEPDQPAMPYPFTSAAELLALTRQHQLSIAELVLANESVWRSPAQTEQALLQIWQVMHECIERGCRQTGLLPGGLQLRRRAHELYQELTARPEAGLRDQLTVLDWINLYAMAVNEENAAGGRVVTAPTNGAAGVIPAVLAYYVRFIPGSDDAGVGRFLATAGAIGMLYKRNASISAAEVGCQGEIGVACSMAAAGLCAVLGGTAQQVENAAEIGMEHNLGLTCDPIAGLVQVPCIERNTMGAVKAVNAARLALRGSGAHHVSLDSVIETMRQTGMDMQDKYKETATGGLAVNVVAC